MEREPRGCIPGIVRLLLSRIGIDLRSKLEEQVVVPPVEPQADRVPPADAVVAVAVDGLTRSQRRARRNAEHVQQRSNQIEPSNGKKRKRKPKGGTPPSAGHVSENLAGSTDRVIDDLQRGRRKPLSSREAAKLLIKAGFELSRRNGGHDLYDRPDGTRISLPRHTSQSVLSKGIRDKVFSAVERLNKDKG